MRSVWRTRGSLLVVPDEPTELLSDAPLGAAVAALAERNRHHFDRMSEAERAEAVDTWRDLAVAVLTAASAAIGSEAAPAEGEGPGRAVIVFEDAGGDEVAIHASFFPQLEDLGGGEVAVTPAQATALEVLNGMAGAPEG